MRLPKKQNKFSEVPSKDKLLAKTFRFGQRILPGRTVYEHGLITGIIAGELIKLFSKTGRTLFSSEAIAAAAVHDCGKISPPFFARIMLACGCRNNLVEQILSSLQASNAEDLKKCEQYYSYHAGLSCITLLSQFNDPELKEIAYIAGRHHGFPPPLHCGDIHPAEMTIAGSKQWQELREEVVKDILKYFGISEFNSISYEKSLLWSGLTAVSDWIASSPYFDDPHENYLTKIPEVFKKNGLVKPVVAQNLDFGFLFRSSDNKPLTPNFLQRVMFDIVQAKGIYIVQAPMGLGKTEAALFASYKILSGDEARGIYAALPTRLTASQMHVRVQSFLDRALLDSTYKGAFLIHSGVSFLSHAGADASVGGDFFKGSRRKILAPFAVGTIDQSLLSVLNCKYHFVRFFGLADKVVILDEVHSYDAYVSRLIALLLEKLQSAGATIIILSATLTKKAAAKLLNVSDACLKTAYPAITCAENGRVRTVPIQEAPVCSFLIDRMTDASAIDEALNRALTGEQVLWIENTVKDAQAIYRIFERKLSKNSNINLGLLHSRFTAADRSRIEKFWLMRLGKDGKALRTQSGAILVGTQILEQSLDIDADCLITRLCPGDFLLQRLGRVWRHSDTLRPDSAKRRCTLLTPSMKDVLLQGYSAFGKSAYVYEPYILARTLEILESADEFELSLPEDVQPFIEKIYEERSEQGVLNEFKTMVTEGCEALHHLGSKKLEKMALNMQASDRSVSTDEVMTRYLTMPVVHCLLLSSLPKITDSGLVIKFCDGHEIVLKQEFNDHSRDELNIIVQDIESSIVSIPKYEVGSLTIHDEIYQKFAPLFKLLYSLFPSGQVVVAVVDEERVKAAVSLKLLWDFGYYTKLRGFETLKEVQ